MTGDGLGRSAEPEKITCGRSRQKVASAAATLSPTNARGAFFRPQQRPFLISLFKFKKLKKLSGVYIREKKVHIITWGIIINAYDIVTAKSGTLDGKPGREEKYFSYNITAGLREIKIILRFKSGSATGNLLSSFLKTDSLYSRFISQICL